MKQFTRNGSAEIENGRRLIKMLCGHWSRKFDVRLDDGEARIVFPKEEDDADYPDEAVAILRAGEQRIEVRISAPTQVMRDAYWSAIDDHLDRFATREGGLRLVAEPA